MLILDVFKYQKGVTQLEFDCADSVSRRHLLCPSWSWTHAERHEYDIAPNLK